METLGNEALANPSEEQASKAQVPSPTSSIPKQDDTAQIKGLLSEARATRDVLVDFRAAIESGSYNGNRMLALAKGLSFLEAILNQNQTHIKNLQGRLEV